MGDCVDLKCYALFMGQAEPVKHLGQFWVGRVGCSTQAKTSDILENAVRPKLGMGMGMGTTLAAIGRSLGGVNIKTARDTTPVKTAVLK